MRGRVLEGGPEGLPEDGIKKNMSHTMPHSWRTRFASQRSNLLYWVAQELDGTHTLLVCPKKLMVLRTHTLLVSPKQA